MVLISKTPTRARTFLAVLLVKLLLTQVVSLVSRVRSLSLSMYLYLLRLQMDLQVIKVILFMMLLLNTWLSVALPYLIP